MIIKIDESMLNSGGYIKIKTEDLTESAFVNEVNKRLGEYWVATGRERSIETVMFEVLAEFFDRHNKIN